MVRGPQKKCARPNQRGARATFFLNILMNDFKHRNITPNTMVTGLGHVTPVVHIVLCVTVQNGLISPVGK